ncbi:phosphate signaling complex PhoU family protein [Pseudonocardia sp. H11422]|uniref:phosphate signaling complex PhoU family protein n=1 Tax=Pseudonocardia sp. H11422 TaxID=2835866 RepID=UPI0027E37EB4|nr:PhoU domain-containing protein [Pseudonocardia sp. H11422]
MTREMFHAQLDELGDDLEAMCTRVARAMGAATRAMVAGDVRLAEQVIAGDSEIDADRARCEQRAVVLLALQAPVARDLRTVVSLIQVAEHLERMGDLARHVTEVVRRQHPDPVAPRSCSGVSPRWAGWANGSRGTCARR